MPEEAPPTTRRLIEVGWILAGRFDAVDMRAIQQARGAFLRRLQQEFPGFAWQMPLVHRREAGRRDPVEPVDLFDLGAGERDMLRWDFALVVTDLDLQSYFKPYTLGAPSKAINVAALSTARIDPAFTGELEDDSREEILARRLTALAFHLFGHLNGLGHREEPEAVMYDVQDISDLDAMERLSEDEREILTAELEEEADVRLEETGLFRGKELLFFVRAAWLNGLDILGSVYRMQPWLFPLRLSRLTTAAASTLLILIITAEAWDLGMSQPPGLVVTTSLVALLGTSLYVIKRQALLERRRPARLSEQRVIASTSIVIAVLIGMFTTYALLFAGTLFLSLTLFRRALVEEWAASLAGDIGFGNYLILAGFVAALGILIGALGASFEGKSYFRHITYVDEET